MNYAFRMMYYGSKSQIRIGNKSRYYKLKRKDFSKNHSKNQSGKGNSQYGTTHIYNIEKEISMRVPKKELNNYLSQGWKKGRRYNIAEDKKLAYKYLNGFLSSSYETITPYIKSIGVHHDTAIRVFKDHLNMSLTNVSNLKKQIKSKKLPKKELHPTIQHALDKLN